MNTGFGLVKELKTKQMDLFTEVKPFPFFFYLNKSKGLDKREMFGDQTLFKHCLVTKHFTVWTPCLVLFDRVWSCLIKFEGHQTFDQKRKTFLLFSCLMGDVLFVWTAVFQTCLMRHAYHACSAAGINCLTCV